MDLTQRSSDLPTRLSQFRLCLHIIFVIEELKLKQFKNMGDYARDYFMKSIYLTNIAIKYRNIVKGICKRTAA